MVATVPFELNLPGEPLGHMHVMAAANLQMAPWGVAIGGDLDETFVGVSRLRMGLIGLAIIALVVTSGVTLVGARLLVAPVQRLTDAAQRIAAGDLRMPLHAAEGGEIGAMATALEHMRRQLLDNIDDLAQLNTTLETRVATRTEELGQQRALAQQLLHRAIAAQEEERARLAHELHDEIGQMLTAVQLSLDRLGKALPAESDVARERLGQVRSLTTQTLSDLRRVIADLRPGILDQLGLAPALDWVGEHTLRPLGLSVTVETQIAQKRLPPAVETILFRIAQEAMHNVARHSGANHLQVSLISTEHDVHLTLVDDGRGFSPSDIAAPFDHGRGLGLAGMHERASLVGGRLEIKSAPGRGTTIHVIIPLPASSEEGLKT
jgi:signal transduction histidine kinase